MKHPMNNSPVLNRTGTLPDDGWYHVAPIGEFAVTTGDGKRILQVIDDKAVKSMADKLIAGAGPLLVDYDHFSYDVSKPSEAAGWITALEARPEGLFAKIEWTDVGSAAVLNKRYRFASPVWYPSECETIANGKIRPLRLDSIALTNSPNLKGMRPLSNRADREASLNNRAGEIQMNELKKLLGLAEAATDADVVAAVAALKNSAAEASALKNRAETAEGKLEAAETKQLEADADAFCDTHAAVIQNREKVREQFILNRAGTEALFGSIKPAVAAVTTEKTPIHNRQKAGEEEGKLDPAAEAKAAAIKNRAHEIMNQRKCSWPTAFNAAQGESK